MHNGEHLWYLFAYFRIIANTVQTIDNQHTTDDSITETYSFDCANGESADAPLNGAFGPINDAHAYATFTLELFDDWLVGKL